MNKKIKTGKEVVKEFFVEIKNIEGIDKKTVDKLVELYRDNKFTDSYIQNALEDLKQSEVNSKIKDDDKN